MRIQGRLAEAEEKTAEQRWEDGAQLRKEIRLEKGRTPGPTAVTRVVVDRAHLAADIAAGGDFEERLQREIGRPQRFPLVGLTC